MVLVFWLKHRLSWQDGLVVWADMSKVNVFVMAAMARLGIEYTAPVQPVTIAAPATMAPSMRLTAGDAQGFDAAWNGQTAPSHLGAGRPEDDAMPEAGVRRGHAGRSSAGSATAFLARAASQSAGNAAALPREFVRLPYDDGLARQDAHRDVKVQQFDAKRFGEDFVDIRTGAVASTWTWRLSYTDRARQALQKRYAEKKVTMETVASVLPQSKG